MLLRWLPVLLWVGVLAALGTEGPRLSGDGAHLQGTSMRLGWELRTGQLGAFLADWFSLLAPHPPGAYLLPALLYALAGPVAAVPLLASGLVLLLAWDGVARLTREAGGRGAWTASLAFAVAPVVWEQSLTYGFDLVCAAVAVQCLSRLAASRGLDVRREAAAGGVWLGLGFWTKYTFAPFLVGPSLGLALWLLWSLVRHGRPSTVARLKNLGLLVAGFAASAGPLLLLRGQNIARYVFHSLAPGEEGALVRGYTSRMNMDSFERAFFYLGGLKVQLGWPGLALLALGLAALGREVWSRHRQRNRDRDPGAAGAPGLAAALTLLASLGGLAILTFGSVQRSTRYMLPALLLLPAAALPPLARRIPGGALVALLLLPPLGWLLTEGPPGQTSGAACPVMSGDGETARDRLSGWGSYPRPGWSPEAQHLGTTPAWLQRALLQVARILPGEGGQLGLMAEFGGGPGFFGTVFWTCERLGLHWDFVTVAFPPGDPGQGSGRPFHFIGPFFHDQQPRFEVLLIVEDRPSPRVQSYLARFSTSRVIHQDNSEGVDVRVLKVSGGW